MRTLPLFWADFPRPEDRRRPASARPVHYNLGGMSAVAVQDEIARAIDAIHAATGERPGMFWVPYGVWPPPWRR